MDRQRVNIRSRKGDAQIVCNHRPAFFEPRTVQWDLAPMKTKTHFAFRLDIWDDIGDSIVEHVAGVDDFEVAEATYRAAVTRWPAARTLKRRDVPIAPRAPQQKKARRSCGRKHTSAPAFIIKLLIRTRRGVFRDV